MRVKTKSKPATFNGRAWALLRELYGSRMLREIRREREERYRSALDSSFRVTVAVMARAIRRARA